MSSWRCTRTPTTPTSPAAGPWPVGPRPEAPSTSWCAPTAAREPTIRRWRPGDLAAHAPRRGARVVRAGRTGSSVVEPGLPRRRAGRLRRVPAHAGRAGPLAAARRGVRARPDGRLLRAELLQPPRPPDRRRGAARRRGAGCRAAALLPRGRAAPPGLDRAAVGHARARRVGRRERHGRDQGGGGRVPPEPVRRPGGLGRRGGASPGSRGGHAGPAWPPPRASAGCTSVVERLGAPTILHVDMDAFFASVEVLDDPSLAGKPVIVGGAGARGVVASCTYEARAYGVHSAMPSLAGTPALSRGGLPSRAATGVMPRSSGQLHGLLVDVTPLVEPIGLDEAFLDVAGARAPARAARDHRGGPAPSGPRRAAARMRGRRRPFQDDRQAGLPGGQASGHPGRSSTGAGVVVVEAADELSFLHAHDVEALWGVGPATARASPRALGVRTVGELAALPVDTVVRRLGRASGSHLAALARGEDPDPVIPDRANKSIGHEETFSQDLSDRDDARAPRRCAWPSRWPPCSALRRPSARTVTVKVKFADLSVADPFADRGPSAWQRGAPSVGWRRPCWPRVDVGRGIRLLGVSASGLHAGGADQLVLRPRRRAERGRGAPRRPSSPGTRSPARSMPFESRFGRDAVGSASMVSDHGVEVPARRDAPWGPEE